jgi:monothiol glutaredoxin
MGIRSKIKKRLPIFGRKSTPQPPPASSTSGRTYTPPVFEEPVSARGDKSVSEFIQEFVSENKVVLFMKGTPDQPQCGFSANAAGILVGYDKDFASFDVISDPDVRQGVKNFSTWPTIPQIYIHGEFVGGSDILSQMHEGGELGALINPPEESTSSEV